jgi:hypothetical protein
MAKANKVEVQKGPLKAHTPTFKSATRAETTKEDNREIALRRDGMISKLHIPKQ